MSYSVKFSIDVMYPDQLYFAEKVGPNGLLNIN